jgi:hypothetical protein
MSPSSGSTAASALELRRPKRPPSRTRPASTHLAARPPRAAGIDAGSASSSRGGERLGGYLSDSGERREVVCVPSAGGSTLVVDRRAGTLGDARLVERLGADEPRENARVLCRLYLADQTRGRCRALSAEDLETAVETESAGASGVAGAEVQMRDAEGYVYRIRVVASSASLLELRWTRGHESQSAEVYEPLTLRDVVGHLEDYEPARSATTDALARGRDDERVSTSRLAAELERLLESSIVLNRGLREALERVIAERKLSMSEIAMRCGRTKREQNGGQSGEASWLARRVGLLPEGGKELPTPWISSAVLALIARDGLGVAPNEVELA